MAEPVPQRLSKLATTALILVFAAWAQMGLGIALLVIGNALPEFMDFMALGFVALLLTSSSCIGAAWLTGGVGALRVQVQGQSLWGRRLVVLALLLSAPWAIGGALAVLYMAAVVAIAVIFIVILMLGGFDGIGHGRPLRGLRRRGLRPRAVTGLPRDIPAGLAWARSAQAEHESVAVFDQLAVDLARHQAPADLVQRARDAADDERDHTLRCLALAERHLGVALAPREQPRPAPADLATIAAEAWSDGIIGEGFAAAVAAEAARTTDDEATSRDLAVIAADEARHAELSRDIVRWALSLDRPEVTQAVEEARRQPQGAPAFPTLPHHGGVSAEVQRRLIAEVAASA